MEKNLKLVNLCNFWSGPLKVSTSYVQNPSKIQNWLIDWLIDVLRKQVITNVLKCAQTHAWTCHLTVWHWLTRRNLWNLQFDDKDFGMWPLCVRDQCIRAPTPPRRPRGGIWGYVFTSNQEMAAYPNRALSYCWGLCECVSYLRREWRTYIFHVSCFKIMCTIWKKKWYNLVVNNKPAANDWKEQQKILYIYTIYNLRLYVNVILYI